MINLYILYNLNFQKRKKKIESLPSIVQVYCLTLFILSCEKPCKKRKTVSVVKNWRQLGFVTICIPKLWVNHTENIFNFPNMLRAFPITLTFLVHCPWPNRGVLEPCMLSKFCIGTDKITCLMRATPLFGIQVLTSRYSNNPTKDLTPTKRTLESLLWEATTRPNQLRLCAPDRILLWLHVRGKIALWPHVWRKIVLWLWRCRKFLEKLIEAVWVAVTRIAHIRAATILIWRTS